MQPAPVGGIVLLIELSDGAVEGVGDCKRDPRPGQRVFILLAPDRRIAVELPVKQRWGKKVVEAKIIAHKKIQSPLSNWIF